MHKKIIFIILFLSIDACNNLNNMKLEPTEPNDNDIPSLPALSDSIPFNSLGSGKIVFRRIMDGIYVIDLDNKKSWGMLSSMEQSPQISPDGKNIVFIYYIFLAGYQTYLVDIYGKNLKCISNQGGDRCPAWFPDNNRIIYHANVQNSSGYLSEYALIYDLKTNIAKKIIDLGTIDSSYCSASERDIISVSNNGLCITSIKGISTFNLDGRNFKTIIKNTNEYTYYCPTWNPNGDKFAAMAIKTNKVGNPIEMNLIIFNRDGSEQNKIFTSPEESTAVGAYTDNYYSLCWSPDGSKILFNRREGNSIVHIYKINADGTNLIQVTSLPGAADISLSWGK